MNDWQALVDFAAANGTPRRLAFARPSRVWAARTQEAVMPTLAAAEGAAAQGHWVVGFVSYEAAAACDTALATHAAIDGLPLAAFAAFDAPQPCPETTPLEAREPGWVWHPRHDAGWHADAVASLRKAIANGMLYQANLTQMLTAHGLTDSQLLYEQLRHAQAAPWCAWLRCGHWDIASASPELFFQRQGRHIVTRPMKGTATRGRWPEEDRAHGEGLAASLKDRAENLMIVDLLRNDLGRLAEPGTVQTPTLFAVERYPTVWQMTSTVTATLRDGVGLGDLFASLFPCGSITGAPKVSASQWIKKLESEPRGIYCGAIGLLSPDGEQTFNVAIRSALIDRRTGEARYGAGGGITFDSSAAAEYCEMLSKSRILTTLAAPPGLFETLRLEADGRCPRLARHLARLAASADYYGWPFDPVAATAQLDAACKAALGQAKRLRLTLSPDGALRVDCLSMPPETATTMPLPVALAQHPVDAADPRLYHKRTDRGLYETAAATAPQAFDVLLWNAQGEATEFTRGNIVADFADTRLTPPVPAGLLAGTLRAEWLAQGRIHEAPLPLEKLLAADRLWFINSLRGALPVTFDDAARQRLITAPFQTVSPGPENNASKGPGRA